MKKYCLTIGNYGSDETFVVDDLDNVNQLYGAMRSAVESGHRLVNVYVSDCD